MTEPGSRLVLAETRPVLSRAAAWALAASYLILVAVVVLTTYRIGEDLADARADRCAILRAQLALSVVLLADRVEPTEPTSEEVALVNEARAAVVEACGTP